MTRSSGIWGGLFVKTPVTHDEEERIIIMVEIASPQTQGAEGAQA